MELIICTFQAKILRLRDKAQASQVLRPEPLAKRLSLNKFALARQHRLCRQHSKQTNGLDTDTAQKIPAWRTAAPGPRWGSHCVQCQSQRACAAASMEFLHQDNLPVKAHMSIQMCLRELLFDDAMTPMQPLSKHGCSNGAGLRGPDTGQWCLNNALV